MDYNSSTSSALWSGQSPSLDKSSQILIREYPHRAIAIASESHALILRHSQSTSEAIANGSLASVASARPRSGSFDNIPSKCMVEFTSRTDKLLLDYRPLTSRPIYGTLGMISIGPDVFICVITQASRVATLRPGETVEKIESVQFFCLNSPAYDDVFLLDVHEEMDATAVYGQPLGRRDPMEHPCVELQKLLSNGTFYYSTDFDITNRMQDRPADAVTFDIDNFDESFLWNSYMIRPLVEFRSKLQEQERDALDASRILTSAIRGFCRTWAIPQTSAPLRAAKTGLPSYLTIISRVVFSYAQVRGSVPVFWEQQAGLLPNQQKITITRSPDGTQPAFNKHFSDLEQAYGAVHVINLLSVSKPGEYELTSLYRTGIRNCPLSRPEEGQSRDHALLRATEYDFHAETKGPQGYEAAHEIRRYLESSADGFAYYLAHEADDGEESAGSDKRTSSPSQRRYVVVLQQEGVFRTNCLDCLDRTNLIQTIVSQMAVETFLGHQGEGAASDFWSRHANLWADNGDALSRIYAGTGALKSSFTRSGKMSFAGAIADVRKSATRLYVNNFTDKQRQMTIDTLLGRMIGQGPVHLYDPISDYVSMELQRRSNEFSTNEKIRILIGTFNLNGKTDGIDEDLSSWLCPPELGEAQPEIVAIGFQEIVELNPQQIMNSDPTRKQLWERAIKGTLDRHYNRPDDEKYVLLRSGQLVGAALCIFVKASALHNIKNVEGSVKKTGLSGMAGNKGAVAIRLDYANTPICFVTAHLAAGFTNYEERNRDYATISHGLRFQRNRGINDHESVIWFGDFNYRIGLDLENTKDLVRKGDLPKLYANDQLNLQMMAGYAFHYYSEARITFNPTYKYDVGTDTFDTSEKARIPAWTDRILRKGHNLRQLCYNSAPLRFSDHRPVYAVFECTVNIVNERIRNKISRDIYERRKADIGGDMANLAADDSDDEDLIGYDAIEPGLPPASSDRQKWWMDNGKMPRSAIQPPKPESPAFQTILNPKRPANPYMPTDEPDWVNIPRSESRLSSFSSLSTSPFEHVNHSMLLSTSASNSAPRRPLPPPFDPSNLPAKVGRLQLTEDGKNGKFDTPPPPPPPRRQTGMGALGSTSGPAMASSPVARKPVNTAATTATPPLPARSMSVSSQNTVKQKAAPPVAKKPAHLAAPSSPGSSSSAPAPMEDTVTLSNWKPLQPERSSNPSLSGLQGSLSKANGSSSSCTSLSSLSDRTGDTNAALQPPRRVNTSTGFAPQARYTPPGGVGLIGLADVQQKTQVPGRKPVPVSALAPPPALVQKATTKPEAPQPPPPRKSNTVNLLDDDDSGGMQMGGWQALKPS
ncbi:putative synaptojanin-like protein [Sordaria macrospora k-hell]|uniref:phosphoinositide 5-phosphatase n=1 Tax=Sordaria macrospora (strain ATCC MYA-333 / DSM 997 / K(L3346) / K-hell) TaxID=771870 RepID=F7W1V3_SORMK|nr:putative synaptojanin-like protein [Sordaria macrospora k-hell]CCC11590.1 putative synaptojanin-like protein [Sordaria macrospora k-hell]